MTAKIILTLESDAEIALKWLEGEAREGIDAIESLALPLIEAIEPTVVAEVKAGVTEFLDTLVAIKSPTLGGAIEDIEQAFIEDLEATGSALLPTVKGLGSGFLQAIIAMARTAITTL